MFGYESNRQGIAAVCRLSSLAAALVALATIAAPETGYDLWLRFPPIKDDSVRRAYVKTASAIVSEGTSDPARVAAAELRRGLSGLLAAEVPPSTTVRADGAIVIGTPASSPLVGGLGWGDALSRLGAEGYAIRSTRVAGHPATVIASAGDVGVLYGVFHYLRLVQTRKDVSALDMAERPRVDRRLLNHWDNLDGTIERGYAGHSLWTWAELPGRVDPRVEDYARANASIGINGTVHQQRERQARVPERALPREDRGPRPRLSPLRDPRLSLRELRRPQAPGRPPDRRPPRPRGRPLVEARRPRRSTVPSPTSAASW